MPDVIVSPFKPALPSTGMLYFFYAAGYKQQPWGFDPKDRGGCKVVYFDGALASLQPVPLPNTVPQEARFRPCTIEYKQDITLPGWESYWIQQLQLTKDESTLYWKLEDELAALVGSSHSTHRLLGHSDEVQGDMLLECQLANNGLYCGDSSGYRDPKRRLLEAGAVEWRLLLQVDSDANAGMMWGDLGRIYYWTRQEAVEARQFDDTWLILQCG